MTDFADRRNWFTVTIIGYNWLKKRIRLNIYVWYSMDIITFNVLYLPFNNHRYDVTVSLSLLILLIIFFFFWFNVLLYDFHISILYVQKQTCFMGRESDSRVRRRSKKKAQHFWTYGMSFIIWWSFCNEMIICTLSISIFFSSYSIRSP